MVSISTFAFGGSDVLEFAEELRRKNDMETGLELFFDTRPFARAALYHKYLEDFINSRRIGVHCPVSDCDILADEGTLLLGYSLDRHEECMELAARIGSPYIVLHTNGAIPADRAAIQKKRELFPGRAALLSEMAGQYGCEPWIENVGLHNCRNLVFDQDAYIDLILSGGFYSLVDIGHAHINGWDVPALLGRLKGRIKGIHLHDNDGLSDQHFPIFKGSIQWEPIFKAFRNLSGDFLEILEYEPCTSCEDILLGMEVLRKNRQSGSAESCG